MWSELRPPVQFSSTKTNSHRLARHDKTVLSLSRPLRRCELDSLPNNPRLSPTENLKSERVNSNCPIHTATRQTRQRQDCFVVSGVAV